MPDDDPATRRGRIDSAGPLRELDIVELAGSETGWPPGYLAKGFGADAATFRRAVARFKFFRLGRVADVGCGFGRWSPFLAEANDEVIGFERNEKGVEIGRKLARLFGLANLHFQEADITALPSPSSSFDGAWCCNVLHLTDRGKVLSELNRILRPGGRLGILKYLGAGGVLEKFRRDYAQGGLMDRNAQFALQWLAHGPQFNGLHNFGDLGSAAPMLEEFGFSLDGLPNATFGSARRERTPTIDLQSLAIDLANDEAFRNRFVNQTELAHDFPISIDLVAIKQRDLAPL
jgi:SAM-dependent methyltransferase